MELWGLKTIALFDLWSFEHFFSGASVGFFLLTLKKNRHWLEGLVWIVLLAYLWEGIEWNLELGLSGINRITYWLQGVEFWANRFITDPLLMVSGYLFSLRFFFLIRVAQVFYPAWWVLNLFIFPHCMFLQNLWF